MPEHESAHSHDQGLLAQTSDLPAFSLLPPLDDSRAIYWAYHERQMRQSPSAVSMPTKQKHQRIVR